MRRLGLEKKDSAAMDAEKPLRRFLPTIILCIPMQQLSRIQNHTCLQAQIKSTTKNLRC
jgi:hypothetical protein